MGMTLSAYLETEGGERPFVLDDQYGAGDAAQVEDDIAVQVGGEPRDAAVAGATCGIPGIKFSTNVDAFSREWATLCGFAYGVGINTNDAQECRLLAKCVDEAAGGDPSRLSEWAGGVLYLDRDDYVSDMQEGQGDLARALSESHLDRFFDWDAAAAYQLSTADMVVGDPDSGRPFVVLDA